MSKRKRKFGFSPRGLRRADVAYYIGVSATKFDELVKDGQMPEGKLVSGCRIWDRFKIDDAFDELMDEKAASGWERVKS